MCNISATHDLEIFSELQLARKLQRTLLRHIGGEISVKWEGSKAGSHNTLRQHFQYLKSLLIDISSMASFPKTFKIFFSEKVINLN